MRPLKALHYQQAYYQKNKKRLNRQSRKYYEANRSTILERQARVYKENPQAKRLVAVKSKFGLSAEEYLALKKKQKNRCAICGCAQSERTKKFKELAVDHDPSTKKVRGLLCNPCNRAIGMMKHDPRRLWKAALYLKEHDLAPSR